MEIYFYNGHCTFNTGGNYGHHPGQWHIPAPYQKPFFQFQVSYKPKFTFLIIAVVIALIGIIKKWPVVLHEAFWKAR
jgi:hypothetical protein